MTTDNDYQQYFITEINKLVQQFDTYDLDTMKLSFAVAVILMNQFQLTEQFNQLMSLYNNQKTVDVEPVQDSVIQVVKY